MVCIPSIGLLGSREWESMPDWAKFYTPPQLRFYPMPPGDLLRACWRAWDEELRMELSCALDWAGWSGVVFERGE